MALITALSLTVAAVGAQNVPIGEVAKYVSGHPLSNLFTTQITMSSSLAGHLLTQTPYMKVSISIC